MKLKLVAITRVYKNMGNETMPMWRVVDSNEYVISRFTEEPKWSEVGKSVNNFQHVLEGKIESDIKEIYAGFEIYNEDSLTHSEAFQLQNGGTIDFPAEDATKIDVTEQMDGIKGL